MAKLAFLGLGVMGYPMAGHLKSVGHDVTVYNRTTAKADAWVAEHGGQATPTPSMAAKDAEFVFACVGGDDDLRAVTIGDDGAFQSMQPTAIFIDNTTASAQVARALNTIAKAAKLGFIDAPVSGGQAGAEGGTLTVMCGGDAADFARAQPIINAYSKTAVLIGHAGAGQQAKMVNQICIAGLVQGLSEALNFGQTAGLDMEKVLDTIAQGAAQSWQMSNRGNTMINDEFDFGFALDWMIKDLGICMDEAASNGAKLPITAEVFKFYKELSAQGFGRNDTSALIKRLR
ncbi:MAG: NAD(P)-dependent oxidoreductase [Candidatus Puniceispirillales bacterium WSBS_2018_MAG_OTU23]